WTFCRIAVVERAIGRTQNAHLRELRRPPSNWIAQRKPTLLQEHERRRGRDRLRHGRDAKQRVTSHRQPALDITPAGDSALDHFAISPDQGCCSGDRACVDERAEGSHGRIFSHRQSRFVVRRYSPLVSVWIALLILHDMLPFLVSATKVVL